MTTTEMRLMLAGLTLAAASAYAADPEGPAQADEDDIIQVPGGVVGRMGESATVDPEEFDFSDAERRLWLSDHLANIVKPARLYYEFQKAGTFEDGFIDSVLLDVLEFNADGTKNTDMQFFTGGRTQPFGPGVVTEVKGNPVLGVYMQGDVQDMSRLTSGNWRYFQRSIKMAFAEGAAIEPVTIDFGGRTVQGFKVSITPFVNDPRRRVFEQFADKRYEFTLSEEIPGTIYQIHTVVPGENGAREPLIEETLTLREVRYRTEEESQEDAAGS